MLVHKIITTTHHAVSCAFSLIFSCEKCMTDLMLKLFIFPAYYLGFSIVFWTSSTQHVFALLIKEHRFPEGKSRLLKPPSGVKTTTFAKKKRLGFLKQAFSEFLDLLVCMPFASAFWCPEPNGLSQMSLWEHVQGLGACRSASMEIEARPSQCDNAPP